MHLEPGYDGVTATDGRTGESVEREFSKQAEADLGAMFGQVQKLVVRA